MLEAFLNLLAGTPGERTVWTADITYWMAGQRQCGHWRAQWDTEEGFLALHRDLGLFPYYYYEKFWACRPVYSGGVEEQTTTDHNTTLRHIRTPVGQLVEETVYSPLSASTACRRHFVESPRDLDVLEYLLERRRLEPDNLEDYARRRRLWESYDGLPSLGLPRSPLAALVYEWAGVENAVYLLNDCPDQVAAVLARMEEQEQTVVEAVCAAGPPLVHFPDNLSADTLAGLYDRHLRPVHRRRLDRLHAAGIRAAVHLDGAVRGLLPKLIDAGFDAVEAITPRPGGDMEIEEIQKMASGRPTVLWGGVPGVLFARPFTREQVRTHVNRLLASWGRGRFVMGVADQIPPDGHIALCREIADFVKT